MNGGQAEEPNDTERRAHEIVEEMEGTLEEMREEERRLEETVRPLEETAPDEPGSPTR